MGLTNGGSIMTKLIRDFGTPQFLVSVQWGSGPHYFVTPKPIARTEALELAGRKVRSLKRQLGKRGALPTVRVLETTAAATIRRKRK